MIPKLQEWLEKQGYPLEMKVAKELSKNGFHPLQSNYYKDAETEKYREIDVVGQIGYTCNQYKIIFQLIIECKNNTSKPWIAFSSNTHNISDQEFLSQRPATRIGNKYLNFISENKLFGAIDFFKKPKTFAYNITQAFETESDKVYSALLSVLNAVKYRRESTNSNLRLDKNCEIYYPIIVLGGRLFDCYLDENNESKIEEIDNKILLWKNKSFGTPNSLIEIMTFESLKKKLPNLDKNFFELVIKKSEGFFSNEYSNYALKY